MSPKPCGPNSLPARVLLVEDNAIVAMNAEELLIEIGVSEVVIASSVAEAHKHCDAQQFDFALLDVNLGAETSLPIASRLHSANIPLAFASGLGEQLDLPPELLDCAILGKPYLLEDLERTLRGAQQAN